jgi:hypothetical protein
MVADEPSVNSSYRFAHVAAAYSIAMTLANFGHPWWGVAAAAVTASVKEWLWDPYFEHDALGWWNPPPLQNIGGSLQDWTFWLIGAGVAAAVLAVKHYA